jgi:hypothetical protein
MGDVLIAIAVKLLVALIESDGFTVLAHHAFHLIMLLLVK